MKLISAYSDGSGAVTFKLGTITDKQIMELAEDSVSSVNFMGYLESAMSDIGCKDVYGDYSDHIIGIREGGVFLFTGCFVEKRNTYLKKIEDLGGDRIFAMTDGCIVMYERAYLWKSDLFSSPQVELVAKGEITFNQIL